MIECGVLYIAFGKQYQCEALASIAAVRSFHPRLPCCIITDSDIEPLPAYVKILLRAPEAKHIFRAKPRYLRESPFDRTLFLDTDTTTVRPIEDLFRLLDRFDIGAYMLPSYIYYPKYGYLICANSGVILFQRCKAVSETFDRWLELFDQKVATEASASSYPFHDDPHLMYAICEGQARVVPLPASMNFHILDPIITASPIHIVHGRHPDPVGLARLMDRGRASEIWDPRVWVEGPLPHGSLRTPGFWLHAPLYALHVLLSRLLSRLSTLASIRR
jgi:hypothetical protein